MRKTATSIVALLGFTAFGSAVTTASADSSTYGESIVVGFGANLDSQLPVTLDLPAAGPGVRIASVGFRWRRIAPTYTASEYTTTTVLTPSCGAGEACHVETSVSTARFDESSWTIGVLAYGENGTVIGSTSRTLPTIDNPKPAATLTSPHPTPAVWGSTTLAADAVPGPGGAAVKGVRFYVNPTGRESDPYLFDDSAPYAVEVDALDIAEPGHQGRVYVVAEDAKGNLSQWDSDTSTRFTRSVMVGPPATMAWTSPAPNQPAGGTSTDAHLEWRASISDLVPPTDTAWTNPYIERVEILIDGQPWADTRDDQAPAWANYESNSHLRSVSYEAVVPTSYGLSPGGHVATLLVTTSYGSVGSLDLPFLITDGVVFSPITTGDGRTVKNGFVVTAGSTTRLKATVAGKVAGSHVVFARMRDDHGDLVSVGDGWCPAADWVNCPGQVTVRGDYVAPSTPGDYEIRITGQESKDVSPQTITRIIHVQPASYLTANVSAFYVKPGTTITVSGRLRRVDTNTGMGGVPVTLQWRAAGSTTWRNQTTITSGRYGWITATSAHRVTGSYRWVTAGIPGKIGPSTSRQVLVHVTAR